jgi:threonine dehydrogenase-like Zn-dependent dehydrogenase
MRAITVVPRQAGSASLDDVPEPDPSQGALLATVLALGICGTDGEIIRGEYAWAPPGEERLILGHESLGRVREAPDDSGFVPGDLVVGIVRRPDPVPCACCARGEWDFCRNGRYTERGDQGAPRLRLGALARRAGVRGAPRPGARGRRRPSRADERRRQGVAADRADRRTGVLRRAPRARDRRRADRAARGAAGRAARYEIHVLDQVTEGPKPDLVARLGGTYHHGAVADVGEVDIVIEATGVGKLVVEAIGATARNGIVCLTGVSSGERSVDLDIGGLNRTMVLENDVMFGSVNANRRHYEDAAEALGKADRDWLRALITRRVPLDRWQEVLERKPDDVKVVVALDSPGRKPASPPVTAADRIADPLGGADAVRRR